MLCFAWLYNSDGLINNMWWSPIMVFHFNEWWGPWTANDDLVQSTASPQDDQSTPLLTGNYGLLRQREMPPANQAQGMNTSKGGGTEHKATEPAGDQSMVAMHLRSLYYHKMTRAHLEWATMIVLCINMYSCHKVAFLKLWALPVRTALRPHQLEIN